MFNKENNNKFKESITIIIFYLKVCNANIVLNSILPIVPTNTINIHQKHEEKKCINTYYKMQFYAKDMFTERHVYIKETPFSKHYQNFVINNYLFTQYIKTNINRGK